MPMLPSQAKERDAGLTPAPISCITGYGLLADYIEIPAMKTPK